MTSGFAKVKEAPANSAHLAILQRFGGKHGQRLVAAVAAGQLAAPLAARAYRRLRHRDDFTITVPASDDVYPALHEWVLERMPEADRKALIAATSLSKGLAHGPHDVAVIPRVRLRYDGERQQRVMIDGHRTLVGVAREELSANEGGLRERLERIVFTASSAAGRDAVVRMIEGVLDDQRREAQPPAVFLPSRWGPEWMRRADLPIRSLESTILKAGQLERLVADLGAFLAAEDDYNRLSQPWHRGYLFHGAPGTGKTSVTRALAAHFGLPVYYLPLGDLKRDTDLTQLVAGVQPRSVLLLEDVDAYGATTSREEKKDSVSIAAVLNAIDGIWTPPGLVTVMTTNHRDALDHALLRAGRVDVDEEFTVLDLDQAARMLDYFDADLDPEDYVECAPASLIEDVRRRRLAADHAGAIW